MNEHLISSLTADRIISAGRRGSSRPVIVQTSDGPRLVKLRGARVPDTFLRPLVGDGSADRRRAAYAAFLWKRLRAPRPFLASRQLPPERPRGQPPQWLTRR